MKNKKLEPWRIVVGALAIAFIVYMWVTKDVALIYETMPSEDVLPVILVNVFVTLLKVVGIAAILMLIKFIANKINKK